MPLEGISARKLVLEAARYNVITGYNTSDALELLDRFPAVDGVIVHAGMDENGYRRVIERAASGNPKRIIVLLSPDTTAHHPAAHYHLSSHDPKQLLDLLVEHFRRPDLP